MPYKDPEKQKACWERSKKKRKHITKRARRVWENSEKGKAYKQRTRLGQYGLSIAQYEDLLSAQNGVCAVCRRYQQPKGHSLHVDHNHKTGRVRALLCVKCNLALGMVDDSVDRLQALSAYLIQHGQKYDGD